MARLSSNDILLDSYARLSVLEGVAGVAPRSWSGRGDRASILAGMAAARHRLPNVPEAWFATGTTPLLTAIRKGASCAEDAADIVMSVLGGLSRPEHVEGGELYAVGRAMAGGNPSLSYAAFCLWRHAMHRGMAASRKASRTESVGVVKQTPTWPVRDVGAQMDAALVESTLIDRQWMVEVLETTWVQKNSYMAIARLWVEDPSRSAVEIARIVRPGFKDNTPGSLVQHGGSVYVSKALRDMKALLRERAPSTLTEYVEGGF